MYYEVVEHPHSKEHLLMKVTNSKGRVFACASTWEKDIAPKPNAHMVKYIWKHSRHAFLPYNETTGTYC